jgi:ferredoxin
MLFSEREAELVSLLPIKPFTAAKASRVWKMDLTATRKVLDELAGRAILVDMDHNGESIYTLPPPMAGFFEFSMMRIRGDVDQKIGDVDQEIGDVDQEIRDVDQKILSELFYQYLNVEEDFIRELFTHGETQLGRTLVNERSLNDENALFVLDYERATEIISTATHRGIGTCYCRHKMMHLDRACNSPMNICMTFNTVAASLTKHGYAREVDVAEGLDLLQQAQDHMLVQFGENVREQVNFICNCCGCCCEAMIAARRFSVLHPIHTTNFLPILTDEECNGCGKCVNACPVEALSLISANDPERPKIKRARLKEDFCLGCGLCVQACTKDNIRLVARKERVITPLDSAHRAVVMAIERGKLQNLIFDNRVLRSHRALAALLGAILKLPPIKQALANQQVKSRYLERLLHQYK